LFHLDLYRLETLGQIHGAGVDEYLQPEGVAVIEWAERMFGGERKAESGKRETGNIRFVHIEVVDDNTRCITYEDTGA
jgi:tRNA A37 threonylcarbamoyladenosine biosynthesis protein TsaE